MRRVLLILAVILVVAVAVYMLRPIRGPERDLTLTADAARGEYLIRIGGCVSCHTDSKNGVAMLGGGAPIKTPFGTFYPPNITPDPAAGIGSWTLAQFSDALSNGEAPQGHLYPAFPFDAYTLMPDQDIVDLFAALQKVPPVTKPAPAHEIAFPFNIRFAMQGWKALFFHPRRFEPDPNHSALWNRGAYLANGPSHCVTCHSPRNLFGAIDPGTEFTGNPDGGAGGKAPSLTAAELIRKEYTPELLADLLKTGFEPDFDTVGGAMAEEVEDASSHWTDDDRLAVAAYLLNLDDVASP